MSEEVFRRVKWDNGTEGWLRWYTVIDGERVYETGNTEIRRETNAKNRE